MPILLKISCENTAGTEAKMFVGCVVILIFPVALILGSYALISQAALKSKSMAGKVPGFWDLWISSIMVSPFYGTSICSSSPVELF
jgi:olfactory receptor